ncbi:esterase-like activity of phytase family protein [Lacibacterium aquatile]|uniref:Esterase-like activity of phytase family protein n=1 Tax=Lacibacterium aquatile TaxID=1168082 RepID=A0ABW5DKR8_9PROT
MRIALTACLLAAAAFPALAQSVTVFEAANPASLSMGDYTAPGQGGKPMALSIGIGSGAWHGADDAPFRFWTVGDRGPNIACSDAEKTLGVKPEAICAAAPKGRVYPLPAYTPSIYAIDLDPATKSFTLAQTIPVKTRDGKLTSGLLNPLTVASTEDALDGQGKPLTHDPNGIDIEGIVRLKDGSFILGDENGPSMIEVAADGRIMRRHVPAGTEKDYAAAGYDTVGSLPALLTRRATNRGIESMALSPDGAFVYFIMQNPLQNPDAKAYSGAVNSRLYKLDAATKKIVGEYTYAMDPVATYPGEKSPANSTVRISELTAIGTDRLVVLERTEVTTRLYEVTLTDAANIWGSKWDDAATTPSLELTSAETGAVQLLAKTLRLDTSKVPEAPVKLEGVALAGDGRLMIINDNDFGIDGARTQVLLIDGTGIRR